MKQLQKHLQLLCRNSGPHLQDLVCLRPLSLIMARFVSSEFEEFLLKNGIQHITSAPYHPASNGLAEWAVQIVKKGLKKVTKGSISDRLANVLLSYRIMPPGTKGKTPSEMLLGKRPRTRLDLVKPHTTERVEKKQRQQKSKHDATARIRTFQMGGHVWFNNFRSGKQWIPGSIIGKVGNVTFSVQLNIRRIWRSHQDNLRH